MSIESRITNLEYLFNSLGGDGLQAVPMDWLDDPVTGGHLGPPVGVYVSPGQQRTLDQLAMMDASVPAYEP